MSSADICQACGACCAHYRVSFYWGESDAHPGGSVPQRLTIPITPYRSAMRGTERTPVRCVALDGEVGQHVGCTIYPQRSSTCREFTAGTPECDKARGAYGLAPLAELVAA
ncbi:YkgJ family cysteine cluster protein [Pseudoduganella chitinolytica]|uniref:YkgJ family cysteine cluster protein n=1 Tax=Pseudoduganella chitinolytica TaxID=34070 RepID=A0ABY8BJ11_9BURK|nr:YkgJ family cysteine cluster protein [Pseudoduganella chitinolytica]WEF35971.1 YkgJ family cysteine cluster protein [Pseudoduganella chitinolytica]